MGLKTFWKITKSILQFYAFHFVCVKYYSKFSSSPMLDQICALKFANIWT